MKGKVFLVALAAAGLAACGAGGGRPATVTLKSGAVLDCAKGFGHIVGGSQSVCYTTNGEVDLDEDLILKVEYEASE